MNHLLLKVYLSLAALFFFTGLQADTVNFSGNTTGQPTWNRTINCSTLSGIGSAVAYQTQEFSISSNDTCTLTMTGNTLSDPFLHIYSSPFDPTNQTNNCVAYNDDFSGLDSAITTPLTGGQTYVYVASAFGNGTEGTFDASISCPTATVSLGPVPDAIPTLSTWTLLLLILTLGVAGIFIRKSQH